MNKKGIVLIESLFLAGILLIATRGVVETASNGTLKANGKRIWCKMQNKDALLCDTNNPVPQYAELSQLAVVNTVDGDSSNGAGDGDGDE